MNPFLKTAKQTNGADTPKGPIPSKHNITQGQTLGQSFSVEQILKADLFSYYKKEGITELRGKSF